jgi:rhamnosyltransferase
MDASVIIPTLNGGPRFRQVLEGIAAQRTPLKYEIVVIDSGSRDDTLAMAREFGARVLTTSTQKFNHGTTRDAAIETCDCEAAILLVQDAIPQGDQWLEALVRPLLEDDEAAGAFSRQLPIPGGNPILDQRLAGWIAGKDEPRRQTLAPRDWQELTPFERLERVAFDNVSSAIKRSCWQSHPFGHRPFGEDLAWSTWAIQSGYAIRFEPLSVVEHSHDRSAWYEARRIYCDHRNLHQLLELRTVRRLKDAWRGSRDALRHYEHVLAEAQLSAGESQRRRRWARHYALGEALAQWLAPRVNLAGESGVWGWLDARIRKGI